MPIRSAVVGLTSDPQEIELTPRRLLAYAAGIGARQPCYLDDAAGIVGHPAFCTALEWPAALALREHPEFRLPRAEAIRGVHAEQDSQFHRPIRPGDRLRTHGQVIQVRRLKPGAFLITRYETVDAISGEPVVTSYASTIYRGVEVEGPDTQIDAPPPRPGLEGAALTHRAEVPVTREAPHVYTECAQIWNPIHTERRVALEAGLPDIILHGTATWALAASQLIACCGQGDPARLRRFAGRFAAMVIPGTPITVAHAEPVGDPPGVAFEVINAEGAPAISHGLAVLAA